MLQVHGRLRGEEERQAGDPVADEGDAELLELLRRRVGVDDRLRPRADQHPRCTGELEQVRAHVGVGARVHAADAAGRSDHDAGSRGGPDRRAHRCGAELPGRDRRREVASRHLRRGAGLAEPCQILVGQADDDPSTRGPDPRRHRPGRPDRAAHALDALAVPWHRQPLTDHTRLERNDALASLEGISDLTGDGDGLTHRR